jgi:hypothetical protein
MFFIIAAGLILAALLTLEYLKNQGLIEQNRLLMANTVNKSPPSP